MSAITPSTSFFKTFCSLTLQLAHPIEAAISLGKAMGYPQLKGHTWIPGSTVCASIIAWDGFDQFLKGPLVARLVALAQCGGHIAIVYVVDNE